MPDAAADSGKWLSVIGRSLAYLCLQKAQEAKAFSGVLEKVDFLKSLGLSDADASHAAGSTPESVRVMRAQKRGGKNGRKKQRR
jgi:hypothetical protein